MGTPLAQAAGFADFARFEALRAEARRDANAAFTEVAKEFEALFIQLLLKAARDADIEGGLFNSRDLEFYREIMDAQVALAMADRGALGIGGLLPAPAGVEAEAPVATLAPRPAPTTDAAGPDLGALLGNRIGTRPPTGADVWFDGGLPIDDPDFVGTLRPHAERTARRLGTSAEVLIAQAALETGWGRHLIRHPDGRSTHNFFGIKANPSWRGPVVHVNTLEYFGGKPVRVRAAFRAYEGIEQAFADYADFLEQNPRYSGALTGAANGAEFIAQIAEAGYATDPAYARKVLAIARRIEPAPTVVAGNADYVLR